MKSFVITIIDNPSSVSVAERCIKSAERFDLEVEFFKAITPQDKIFSRMGDEGINGKGFVGSPYSRVDRAISAFLSHYYLWKKSIELNENVLIFEHDAVVKMRLPDLEWKDGCISLGKPSYGKYKTPQILGFQPLQSKPYFPGAHAYMVSPRAAKILVETAKRKAQPTDIFLNRNDFPFLEEYYPWPVEVEESFSTIQKELGCLAKHQYREGYQLI